MHNKALVGKHKQDAIHKYNKPLLGGYIYANRYIYEKVF